MDSTSCSDTGEKEFTLYCSTLTRREDPEEGQLWHKHTDLAKLRVKYRVQRLENIPSSLSSLEQTQAMNLMEVRNRSSSS